MTAPLSGATVYQLKVTLLETSPPVWRRFLVSSDVSLHRLHLILQDVMGWGSYHLYRLEIESTDYSEPHPDNDPYQLPFQDSERARLGTLVVDRGSRFLYEYDFGDSWLHEVTLEDILEHRPGKRYPICVGGQRACPPEDCGGPWGYAELLEVIGDPDHEEHLDMMEWLGGQFDPGAFDVNRVNRMLSGSAQEPEFTRKQGQYLAFIHHYTRVNGYPPARADMQRHFDVAPSTVHQMVLRLEDAGLIERVARQPRSIRVLVPVERLPVLE